MSQYSAKEKYIKSEASRRATQKWAAENPEKIKSAYQKRRLANPKKAIWAAARDRSRDKGILFDIEPEDIDIPSLCPVLGIPIQMNQGAGGQKNSISLDRMDCSKGYTKGNIQIMSRLANVMKADATPNQLLKFADWIYKTYG